MEIKILPHDNEIEATVISTLINYPDSIFTANEIINRDVFTNGTYRMIYDTIERLSYKNIKCDLITLTAELKSKGRFDSSFDEIKLSELTDKSYTQVRLPQHCYILNELQIRRNIIGMSKDIEVRSFDTSTDIETVIDFVQEEVFKNTAEDLKSEPEHIGDITVSVVGDIEYKSKNPDKIGIHSGWSGLKWHDSDLIIGAGRPAMGKTWIGGIKWAFEAAMYGDPVLIFSLEMSKNQIVQRFNR